MLRLDCLKKFVPFVNEFECFNNNFHLKNMLELLNAQDQVGSGFFLTTKTRKWIEEEVTQVASQKPSQSSNQVAPHFRYPNIFDKKIETLKANHLLKAFLKESFSLVLSTCLAKISTAMPKEMFGALVLVHKRSTYVVCMYIPYQNVHYNI
jgi:hypothetical protein